MKCNNCGAPIQMNQKFCPNCGSPNVEFKKHIDDMEQYNKKFNSTRSKVIGNSKWFVNYIAPITALVITMTALTLAIIGKNSMIGYDIAKKNQQKYYSSHSDEIQTKLKLLLEAGDYATLYSMDYVGDCSIKDNDDKYAWNDFYNVAGDYVYIRKGIISMMERNNSSYYGDEYMNTISRAVADMEDIVSRRLNLSYHSVSKESIKYINDIYEKSHELLKAYCNLTDEDIAGLPDMSQADILTLITRRKKKKFNISLLAYVLCAIMIIIIIPCVSDISGDVFRSKGRMSGYEEDSLYNDFIENNYEGLLEKTEYNTGIGKDIDKDTQDYYTFAIAYKKAVDYRVYVNNGENEKAEQVVKDIDNAQFNNVLFKEALENVKNIYISNGLSQ